jgi:hypothetical protein
MSVCKKSRALHPDLLDLLAEPRERSSSQKTAPLEHLA